MEIQVAKGTARKVDSPFRVYEIMRKILLRQKGTRRNQKYFWTIGLDAKDNLQYVELVALGVFNTSHAEPVDIFSLTVQKRCKYIILVRNAPNGKVEPTKADLDLHEHLSMAATFLKIKVLDHLIITEKTFYSFESERLKKEGKTKVKK